MTPVRRGLLGVVRLVAPGALPRLVAGSAFAAAVGAFLWASPLSPCALWRADVLLAEGDPLAAVGVYEAVARENPMPGVRRLAVQRAAATWAADLDVPSEARRLLEGLLVVPMSAAERASVADRVGELLLAEGRLAEAAVRLREAHDLDPTSPSAAGRLARSARASALADDDGAAEQSWRRLGRLHPEQLARAELGRANLALGRGQMAEALALYGAAVDHAFDPDVASVARLGAATCLERLGDLDEALAELDGADLPREVREQRASTIHERASVSE